MIQHRIRDEVERVGERFRRLWRRRALSLVWLAAAAAGVALLVARSVSGWHSGLSAPFVAAAAAVVALWVLLEARGVAREPRWVARRIEARHPDLDARLLAALEQKPDLPGGRFGYLQETVLAEVLSHARRKPWLQTVPDRWLGRALAGNLATLAVLGAVLAVLGAGPRPAVSNPVSVGPGASGSAPRRQVEVDPGDIEVERGSSLLVVARFAPDAPPEATLVVLDVLKEERRIAMSRGLDDPLFGARIESVAADFEYLVEFGEERSPSYRVTVFEYPEVARSDASLVFPAYTGLEPKTVEDTRRVSAVEGTEIVWTLRLNKKVARAELIAEDGTSTPLEAGEGETEAIVRSPAAPVTVSMRYRVHLVDDRGRENRDAYDLIVRALSNRPPEIKLAQPRGDVRVSPLEELGLEAKVWDDFGILEYGLSYTLVGQPPRDVILGGQVAGKDGREARHLLDFEALQAKPDQLVSYYFWAGDVGPGGEARRSFSDMYFAEVRPFDEIFRQGQQPPEGGSEEERQREQEGEGGEGGQNAQDAEELAEIQKEIVSGTWNLIRRSAGARAPAADGKGADLARDGGLLRDAEESALEQARSLGERLENEDSRADLETVLEAMDEAVKRLGEAAGGPAADPLRPALAAEQSAYEGLLRLRAREFEVVRGNSRSSRSSRASQARSRRQLSQLELSDSRNRYETQRDTPRQRAERPEEAEDRQVSNRLRDLARRQSDVNERLKDMDSALAEAREESEREEAERQLKRLRDEERRILRDTDDLAERMDLPENQERMAESRAELEETREDVRRAAEALEEGRVSQAVAEGTRAARELEELRDEFRRRTARQFVQEMEELRSDAERLERNEEELSRRLGELNGEERRSLRDGGEQTQVRDGLARQRQELDEVLDQMQKTVVEAEKPEPLLAEKLYDTIRETRHTRTAEALDVARTLLERGLVGESARAERQASDGIERLREGIDEAAETVLGDETEALRRAGEELDRLAEEVSRELASAEPDGPEGRRGRSTGEEGRESAGRGEPGPQEGRSAEPGERGSAGEQGEPAREGQRGERGQAGGPSGRGEAGASPEENREAGSRPAAGRNGDEAGSGQGERRPGSGEERDGGTSPGTGGPRRLRGGPDGGGGPEGRGGPRGADDRFSGLRPPAEGDGDRAEQPAPIAGEGFRGWSDRLRDVEEMIDDQDLRSEAARIGDRARNVREEVRHAKAPNWDLVRMSILEPLNELRRRVSEEVLRRGPGGSLVPIDRDPVPPKYAERVREYYEKLGSGK